MTAAVVELRGDLPCKAFGRPLTWERVEASRGLPEHWRGEYRSGSLVIDVVEYPGAAEARRWIASATIARGGGTIEAGASNYCCGPDADTAIENLRARLVRGVALAESLGAVPAAEPMVRAALDALNHPAVR